MRSGPSGQLTEKRFVIGTLIVTIAVAAISDRFHLGWPSAFALAVGMYVLLSAFAILRHDGFLGRLLVFGLVAGITELLADCWLVRQTGTLVYPNTEPMIACSPLYMPLAWAVILVQIGYLGWLISRSKPMWQSILLTALIGLAVIPAFEHFAKDAGWWYYQNCPMLLNAPWYIIVGEGLICAFLPLLFRMIAHRNFAMAAAAGLLQGLWIWLAYRLAWQWLG